MKQLKLNEYFLLNKYKSRFLIILILILIFICIISLCIGTSNLPMKSSVKTILGYGSSFEKQLIFKIRLPRVLSAIVIGISSAFSGLLLQTLFNNDLASPSTLGVSNAAAFGANIAILLTGSKIGTLTSAPYFVTFVAFIFCMISTFTILSLSKLNNFSSSQMILTGVALAALFNAGVIAIQYFANDVQLANAIFWTFGDLGRTSYKEILILFIILIISLTIFSFKIWDLNAIGLGENTAETLGVNVKLLIYLGLFLSSINTAAAISTVGMIGFVGLISPQIVKHIIGTNHKYFLPTSCVFGAIILVAADALARTIVKPSVLPVGVITSFLGAPTIMFVLMKGNKK